MAVAVSVGVSVGCGGESVALAVGVAVGRGGSAVIVTAAVGVDVGVGTAVPVGVDVGSGTAVSVGVGRGVTVGSTVAVASTAASAGAAVSEGVSATGSCASALEISVSGGRASPSAGPPQEITNRSNTVAARSETRGMVVECALASLFAGSLPDIISRYWEQFTPLSRRLQRR